jgi:hypothetical protein
LATNLVALILLPNLALAAPLTGADADVTVYHYKGMMGYTEDTTDANDSDSAGDVMWPEAANTRQAFWGHTSQFSSTVFDVSTAMDVGNRGQNLDLRYWNGSTWTALTLDSQTHPFDTTGVNSVSFTVPGDWALKTINGVEAYYVGTGDGAFSGGTGSYGAQVSQISVLLAGGGGGAAAPEFTDFLYITTLLAGGWYVYTKISKKEQSGLAI